jgi:hypothetical protein
VTLKSSMITRTAGIYWKELKAYALCVAHAFDDTVSRDQAMLRSQPSEARTVCHALCLHLDANPQQPKTITETGINDLVAIDQHC